LDAVFTLGPLTNFTSDYNFAYNTGPLPSATHNLASVSPLLNFSRYAVRNAAYRPPQKPWSDRYPALLYSVLAAAIVSMGYVAVRFLGALKGGASRP